LIFEFMLNQIRLKQGFSKELFEQRTFLDFASIQPEIERLIEIGLIKKNAQYYRTTDKGWAFINSIVEQFL